MSKDELSAQSAMAKLHEQQTKAVSAAELTRIAQEASALGALWLEHAWVVADSHRAAAVACEKEGNIRRAVEHWGAAQYWDMKLTRKIV